MYKKLIFGLNLALSFSLYCSENKKTFMDFNLSDSSWPSLQEAAIIQKSSSSHVKNSKKIEIQKASHAVESVNSSYLPTAQDQLINSTIKEDDCSTWTADCMPGNVGRAMLHACDAFGEEPLKVIAFLYGENGKLLRRYIGKHEKITLIFTRLVELSAQSAGHSVEEWYDELSSNRAEFADQALHILYKKYKGAIQHFNFNSVSSEYLEIYRERVARHGPMNAFSISSPEYLSLKEASDFVRNHSLSQLDHEILTTIIKLKKETSTYRPTGIQNSVGSLLMRSL